MRIGLISDTHIPEAGPDMPPQVYEAFRGVDLILHAGDMHVIDVLDWLETLAPVLGARGNGDYPSAYTKNRPGVPDDPRVKEAHVLQIEELKVGLIHGFPLPYDIPWRTPEEMLDFYFGEQVDVVVCGDTHEARIDRQAGILIINPGSPTLPNQLLELGTIGFLEVNGREAEASIVQME